MSMDAVRMPSIVILQPTERTPQTMMPSIIGREVTDVALSVKLLPGVMGYSAGCCAAIFIDVDDEIIVRRTELVIISLINNT